MSTVTPIYKNVLGLLKSRKFAIDDYQREYKWEAENIVELVNDLLNKFFQAYDLQHNPAKVMGYPDYFLGSIIVSVRDNTNYLIDGQQRTTSLTLLLLFLYHQVSPKNPLAAQEISDLIYSSSLGVRSFNLDIPERREVLDALFKNASVDRLRASR